MATPLRPTSAPAPPGWPTPPGWMAAALCKGAPDLYFAPHAERPPARARREAAARRMCARCPVQADCRDHARRHLEFGLWGGETEGERALAGYPATPVRLRPGTLVPERATG